MNHTLQQSLNLLKNIGASNWLSVLPIDEHGFALHKGDFCDILCLRYVWIPQHIPSQCVGGKPYSVEHALSCILKGQCSVDIDFRACTLHLPKAFYESVYKVYPIEICKHNTNSLSYGLIIIAIILLYVHTGHMMQKQTDYQSHLLHRFH